MRLNDVASFSIPISLSLNAVMATFDFHGVPRGINDKYMRYPKMRHCTGWALALPIILAGCAGGGGSPASFENSPAPAAASAVAGTTSAGVSVSGAIVMEGGGNPVTSDFIMDPDFVISTVGTVGKNGATSTVSKVTITGINTAIAGNTLTITNGSGSEKIDNLPNGSDAYSDATLEERLRTKVISMGTLMSEPMAPSNVTGSADRPFQATYLTFGGWTNCSTGCTAPLKFGMFVYGNATQPVNIPTFGTATYNGFARGLANDLDYEQFSGGGETEWYSQSNMTAVADFSKRTIAFETAGSVVPVTNLDTNVTTVVQASQLNMSGTLVYAAGTNLFSGTVMDVGGRSGTATGRFYGPAVEEIGGVYTLGTQENGHTGFFAGKK